jgi:hypothetical protein
MQELKFYPPSTVDAVGPAQPIESDESYFDQLGALRFEVRCIDYY